MQNLPDTPPHGDCMVDPLTVKHECSIIISIEIVTITENETREIVRKVDLIIHPVRFRILQALTAESLTTQEIGLRLPDVPKSSIYRHLKIMLDGELIDVAEVNVVKGIQERTYQLVQRPHLNQGDMADLTADDHLRYFTTYLMTILRDFYDYLRSHESAGVKNDLQAERTGYSEETFFATTEELDAFQASVKKAVEKLVNDRAGGQRHKHKFAIISHPVAPSEISS